MTERLKEVKNRYKEIEASLSLPETVSDNELYKKLDREGLFSPLHKKMIPSMPRKIGVITSSSGAVIHDIIRTLSRRNPYFDLTLFPSAVQGNQAPLDIIRGIDDKDLDKTVSFWDKVRQFFYNIHAAYKQLFNKIFKK